MAQEYTYDLSKPTRDRPCYYTLYSPCQNSSMTDPTVNRDEYRNGSHEYYADEDEDSSSADENSLSTLPSVSRSESSAATRVPPHSQSLFLNFSSNLSPKKTKKKKCLETKRQSAYKVNGVNILNRNNLDSKTAIERIQRRRENHNHVERRRRDIINNTIYEISQVVPHALQQGHKPNKGHILKLALDHIRELRKENKLLKEQSLLINNGSGCTDATTQHTHQPPIQDNSPSTNYAHIVYACSSSTPSVPHMSLDQEKHTSSADQVYRNPTATDPNCVFPQPKPFMQSSDLPVPTPHFPPHPRHFPAIVPPYSSNSQWSQKL
ncbi:hypothetical protein CLU79DRAFT_739234 [Phycomyces nitens]|nr:hypothetical protein CLU79DRAFT_739234 [Phycomyces nitens]